MNKNYYKNIAVQLTQKKPNQDSIPSFPALKAYEYWTRYFKRNGEYSSPSDLISILPFDSAIKISQTVQSALLSENQEELELVKNNVPVKTPKKGPAHPWRKLKGGIIDFDDFVPSKESQSNNRKVKDDSLDDEIQERLSQSYHERELAADEMNKADETGYLEEVVDCVRQHLDNENIYDKKIKTTFQTAFIEESIRLISQGDYSTDPYIKRIKIIQNTYGLNDLEMEFLIFTWIMFHEKKCEDLSNQLQGRRFKNSNNADLFQFIFDVPQEDLDEILDPKGTLRRMLIINDQLEPLNRVIAFFSGQAGSNYCDNYFKVCKDKAIPFEQLQDGNPDADLMMEMLTHYKKDTPLNLFFYGVEGTGKTALAKAIAAKLGKKLIQTNLATLGDHKDNALSNGIQEKMGSILLANYTFHKDEAILLVDEADLILNGCEKGALNGFLEELNMPIIWITNNTEFIEASSLRRFDFSMKFERLESEKRIDIWKSIIKTQKADKLLKEQDLVKLSTEIPVTAGGITQAIRMAKSLKAAGSKISPKEIVLRMTKAQTELLGLSLEYPQRDSASHAPKYSLDVLNTDVDMSHIMKVIHGYDAKWQNMNDEDRPDALNILLYGVPGTGKTELARYIARELGRKLIIKRASDIMDKYVGESEKNIRQMFDDAEEQQAILFLDEADSLIRDRRGAQRSWEVSQVNELLTRMENFKGIFIAATNFNDNLDQASRRRFALKVKFGYLKPECIKPMWDLFFPKVACPKEANKLRALTPGDFNAVHSQLRFCDESEVTASRIMAELKKEIASKDDNEGRHMGFH